MAAAGSVAREIFDLFIFVVVVVIFKTPNKSSSIINLHVFVWCVFAGLYVECPCDVRLCVEAER